MRDRLAWLLRFLADRLSPDTAFRRTHWSFTFERYRGVAFHESGRGCPIWYSTPDYERAHVEGTS